MRRKRKRKVECRVRFPCKYKQDLNSAVKRARVMVNKSQRNLKKMPTKILKWTYVSAKGNEKRRPVHRRISTIAIACVLLRLLMLK